MSRPLGKRQREELEAHFSRPLIPRDQPLMRACATYVMPCNLEMAIEPDLREMVLQGLAGAEAVHQAHRMFEGSALSGIGADLLIERDEALGRLHAALTAGQIMTAARAASDLSWLGGKAEWLAFLGESAENDASRIQACKLGGSNSEKVKQQRDKIGRRDKILTALLPKALAAGDWRHASNTSHLADWMRARWPSDSPDPKPGERVIANWIRDRRKTHPDDFWNPAGPIPNQEDHGVRVGP